MRDLVSKNEENDSWGTIPKGGFCPPCTSACKHMHPIPALLLCGHTYLSIPHVCSQSQHWLWALSVPQVVTVREGCHVALKHHLKEETLRYFIAIFNYSEAMFCSIFCSECSLKIHKRWRWVWMVVWHLMVWVMLQPFLQPWKERCRNQDRDNWDVAVDTNSSVLCFTHWAPVTDCSLLSPWFLVFQKLNSCLSPRQANIKSYYLHNWNRHLKTAQWASN